MRTFFRNISLISFNSLTANIITANRAGKRMKYLKYDALNFLSFSHINYIVPENCPPNIENGYSPVDKLKLGVAPELE